jgi:hypothetical protein
VSWDDDPTARAPRSVGDSLDVWRRRFSVGAPSEMARITAAWGDVLGPLASEVEPRALVDGTLKTVVTDAAVAEAVRWRAEGWCAGLNAALGSDAVTRIDVRVTR